MAYSRWRHAQCTGGPTQLRAMQTTLRSEEENPGLGGNKEENTTDPITADDSNDELHWSTSRHPVPIAASALQMRSPGGNHLSVLFCFLVLQCWATEC